MQQLSFVPRLSFLVLRPALIPFSRRITIADTESTLNHPPSSPPALHIVLQDCRLRNRSFDLSLSHKEISLNNFLRFQVLPASCDRILRSSLLSSAKAAQSGAVAAEKLKLWTLMYSDSFSEPWNYILLFLRRKSSSCGRSWQEAAHTSTGKPWKREILLKVQANFVFATAGLAFCQANSLLASC